MHDDPAARQLQRVKLHALRGVGVRGEPRGQLVESSEDRRHHGSRCVCVCAMGGMHVPHTHPSEDRRTSSRRQVRDEYRCATCCIIHAWQGEGFIMRFTKEGFPAIRPTAPPILALPCSYHRRHTMVVNPITLPNSFTQSSPYISVTPVVAHLSCRPHHLSHLPHTCISLSCRPHHLGLLVLVLLRGRDVLHQPGRVQVPETTLLLLCLLPRPPRSPRRRRPDKRQRERRSSHGRPFAHDGLRQHRVQQPRRLEYGRDCYRGGRESCRREG